MMQSKGLAGSANEKTRTVIIIAGLGPCTRAAYDLLECEIWRGREYHLTQLLIVKWKYEAQSGWEISQGCHWAMAELDNFQWEIIPFFTSEHIRNGRWQEESYPALKCMG